MRKILPILILSVVFLTPLYPVYAQRTATGPAQIKSERPEGKMLSLQDRIASKEAEFMKKVSKFKDKKKAERVERINTNLNQVNERRTAQMQQSLEKISVVLDRLKELTSKVQTAGKDSSAVNDAIAETEEKWKEASAALKLQMDTDYSIEIDTEKTVKDDASEARNSLRAGLKNVHSLIVDTKQSLAKAISTALSTAKGGNNGTE